MSAIAMVSRFIMIEPKYSKSEPAIFISVGVLRRQLLQQLLRLFQIARVEPFSEPAELLRYRRMIAPDEQGEQHDRNADQRCADEEILEARSLDHEPRGSREQASRKYAKRSHQSILAGGKFSRGERGHVGDEHDKA
jgi:hypothetical protein